jgi:hypothetical protein
MPVSRTTKEIRVRKTSAPKRPTRYRRAPKELMAIAAPGAPSRSASRTNAARRFQATTIAIATSTSPYDASGLDDHSTIK